MKQRESAKNKKSSKSSEKLEMRVKTPSPRKSPRRKPTTVTAIDLEEQTMTRKQPASNPTDLELDSPKIHMLKKSNVLERDFDSYRSPPKENDP